MAVALAFADDEGVGIDMSSAGFRSIAGVDRFETSETLIRVTYASGAYVEYLGSGFEFDDDVGLASAGLLNGYDRYEDDVLVLRVRNLNLDIADTAQFFDQDGPGNGEQTDPDGLIELLFQDADGIIGSDAAETLQGFAGSDSIAAGDGADVLEGGDGNDTLEGGEGKDELNGDAGNDTLKGGVDNDRIQGAEGKDKLVGGRGNDRLDGGKGRDKLDAGRGNDRLNGGKDDDSVKGGRGKDDIKGGAGDDTLKGNSGDDTLNGGVGDDLLNGGDGDDVFEFDQGDAADVIESFEAGAGSDDKIDLSTYGLSFEEVLDMTSNSGGDAVIDLSEFREGDSITLDGIQKTDLHSDDFLLS